MSRSVFQRLVNVLEPLLSEKRITNLEENLYITLWALANKNSLRELSDRFNKSKSTIHKIVVEMCLLLKKLAKIYVKWPTINDDINKTVDGFNRIRRRGFPNVIGCIDGSHIQIKAISEDPSSYYNRKGGVQRRGSIYVGMINVFRNSSLGKGLFNESIHLPTDVHLIGDSAYPLTFFLMTPFKDNGHLTEAQKLYNKELCSIRVLIEQAFGSLKSKFRILNSLNFRSIKLTNSVIFACAILHNFIIIESKEPIEIVTDNIHVEDEIDNTEIENNQNLGFAKRDSLCQINN